MKNLSKTFLAAALLAALPAGNALACSVGAWTANSSTATDADAGKPRYSGQCALNVGGGGKYVTHDSDQGAVSTYRARFYVLLRPVTGTATIFKASSAANAGGTSVIEVNYDGNALSFKQNGQSVGNAISVVSNKWYSVEVYYKAGAAFTATVQGGASNTPAGTVNVTSGIGSGSIISARLGISSGAVSGTAKMGFDGFVSTRSETQAIGRLCRGDANGDGIINIGDRVAVNTEILNAGSPNGQPDCNEDGVVNIGDRVCVNGLILSSATCQ